MREGREREKEKRKEGREKGRVGPTKFSVSV